MTALDLIEELQRMPDKHLPIQFGDQPIDNVRTRYANETYFGKDSVGHRYIALESTGPKGKGRKP